MKKILSWFWADKVSLILLIVTIEFIVAQFITGKAFIGFWILPAAFIVVSIIERGKLMTKMDEAIYDQDLREYFKLPDHNRPKPVETVFATVVSFIIFMGTLVILVCAFLYLIDVI